MAHKIEDESGDSAPKWHGVSRVMPEGARQFAEEQRANAYTKLRTDYGYDDARALFVVTDGKRDCDACGRRYDITSDEILRDHFTKVCPGCTLEDVTSNGDISQAQARAMLAALDQASDRPFDGVHCPDCGATLTSKDEHGFRDCPSCAFCTTTDETSAR